MGAFSQCRDGLRHRKPGAPRGLPTTVRIPGGHQRQHATRLLELAVNHLDGCIAPARLIRPPVAAPIGGHQVQSAVAVEVGEVAAGGTLIRARDARARCDVFKTPVAEIAVENVVAFESAKIDIHTPVAIDVAQGDARPQFRQAVSGDGGLGEVVGESDASRRSGLKGETRTSPEARLDSCPSESGLGLPLQSRSGLTQGRAQHETDHEGDGSTEHAHTP